MALYQLQSWRYISYNIENGGAGDSDLSGNCVGLYARVFNERDDQELLGKVVIGPRAKTSMGVHHWECMLLLPRKSIAQWHKIL